MYYDILTFKIVAGWIHMLSVALKNAARFDISYM